jgi:hypothetical protein
MHAVHWFARHDRGLLALRRAARTAIVMPIMFALGDKVIDNIQLATFAAFGTFALLMLADFGGSMRERLEAQLSLALVGVVFICVGTLASRNAWLAAVAMAVVAFGVLFVGVVSSVLASASTALLLSFILPVSLISPASAIPDRLIGWGMASAASLLAIALLWPAPVRDPVRGLAVAACRAVAARLRSDVAYMVGARDEAAAAAHQQAIDAANGAVAGLRGGFLASPFRPTGLATPARIVVRLVDELTWVNLILESRPVGASAAVNPAACAVKEAAANALERGADLLEHRGATASDLDASEQTLRDALDRMERDATGDLPVGAAEPMGPELISSLEPSFRAQELSFAVASIVDNVGLTAAAERRSWWERLLGRQPDGVVGTIEAARQRASAHLAPSSVWLHNSLRGAIGLGLAVLVSNKTGVQHSFWVVLGTLSVLRSNALNTGQFVLRGVLGTAVGFAVGAGVLAMIGTNETVLWCLLPFAILFAGIAPAVISFAAGQGAFTLVLVILFNLIQPAGWRVGLVRVEDVALGCGVSLVVGLLFWPRGAAPALRAAIAGAYVDSARYLNAAVEFGMLRCDASPTSPVPPTDEANRAAAASRRLDDAFRTYLAERGPKPVSLADMTSLVTGVAALRLASDAVLDLWQRDDGEVGGDRSAARAELRRTGDLIEGWYDDLARSLVEPGDARPPLEHDASADGRLVDAVRGNLRDAGGHPTATAVRMIWTGDHLDAARRLQTTLVEPAHAANLAAAISPLTGFRAWRRASNLVSAQLGPGTR